MSPPVNKYLGLSAKQIEILKFRDAKRLELRELYLREAHHPTKHHLLFDEGLQRHGELRLTYADRFKPSLKTASAPVILFGSMFVVWYMVHISRKNNEHRIRTGQVSYADRSGKMK